MCAGSDPPEDMMKRPRTKTIPGYRIQPMLPLHITFAGGRCIDADFTVYDDEQCVEAVVYMGLIRGPYTLVLSIEQALEADIVERVEGCRCEVCGGRNDDPAGIHGKR